MNILFMGDVVAKSGSSAVIQNLESLKKQYSVDFTIVNAENAAHGKGITPKIYYSLMEAGADVLTLGNHAFSKKEILSSFDRCENLIRPLNMTPHGIGKAYVVKKCGDKKIAVLNAIGNAFMNCYTDKPIPTISDVLKEIDADIIILDFHAEATSEKQLIMNVFRKQLTAVIGTHTHVQTADECIRDGCAYITDVGMCGPYFSILGRDIDEVVARNVNNENTFYKPAAGPAVLNGVLITVDDETNRAVGIRRIQIRPEEDRGKVDAKLEG